MMGSNHIHFSPRIAAMRIASSFSSVLCFSQKLDLGASASVAKSLFHWLRGRLMMLKRMLRIQFL